ncbi:MAG: Rid family hydrolase [Pseudomonadota bacterium]
MNRPVLMQLGLRPLGNGDLVHAPVVRAGHWVFGTGLRAVGADGLLDAGVLRAHAPLSPPPQAQREAAFVFDRMKDLLARAGSSLARVVRVDQYYTSPDSVDPYHVARKRAMAGQVAPSTSVILPGLLNTDALLDVQCLALADDSPHAIERVQPAGVGAPATSGYAPAVRAGDLVFVAGQLARDAGGGIAAEARVPDGQQWNGTRIRRETDYLIAQRLAPALEAAGSGLDLVVKAQVYLSHATDLPAFWQSWAAGFGSRIPPTTVVPVPHPAFGTREATVEVNLIAAHASARDRLRDLRCDLTLQGPDALAACVVDGLVFMGGLDAADAGGLASSARVHDTAPWFHSPAGAQMRVILDKAEVILRAAGSDLSRITRLLQFHRDLSGYHAAHAAAAARSGSPALPTTAVAVNPSLFVPGSVLIADIWAAA